MRLFRSFQKQTAPLSFVGRAARRDFLKKRGEGKSAVASAKGVLLSVMAAVMAPALAVVRSRAEAALSAVAVRGVVAVERTAVVVAILRAVGGAIVMMGGVGAGGVAASHAADKCRCGSRRGGSRGGNILPRRGEGGGILQRDGPAPAAAGKKKRASQRGAADPFSHFDFSLPPPRCGVFCITYGSTSPAKKQPARCRTRFVHGNYTLFHLPPIAESGIIILVRYAAASWGKEPFCARRGRNRRWPPKHKAAPGLLAHAAFETLRRSFAIKYGRHPVGGRGRRWI